MNGHRYLRRPLRRLPAAVVVVLTLGAVLLPGRAVAAEIGTFTLAGGSTIYSVNAPTNPVTLQGTLESGVDDFDANHVTATLDNTDEALRIAATNNGSTTTFTAQFTDRETVCGAGGFTKHTVHLSYDGTEFPSQPLTYRCADSYTVQVEPAPIQTSWISGQQWTGTGNSDDANPAQDDTPAVFVCLYAVDHGVSYGAVPITAPLYNADARVHFATSGKLPGAQGISVQEVQSLTHADGSTGTVTSTDTTYPADGFSAPRDGVNGEGCVAVDHQGTQPLDYGTSVLTASFVPPRGNDANVTSGSYTADLIQGDILNVPGCVAGETATPVTGSRWAPNSWVRLTYRYLQSAPIDGVGTAPDAQIIQTITQVGPDGTFSTTLPAVAGSPVGVVAQAGTSQTGPFSTTEVRSAGLTYNCTAAANPTITVSPVSFAGTSGSRHLEVTGQHFNAAAGCTTCVNLTIAVDGVAQRLADGGGVNLNGTFDHAIDWSPADCSSPHVVTATETVSINSVTTDPITAQQALTVTCPVLEVGPDGALGFDSNGNLQSGGANQHPGNGTSGYPPLAYIAGFDPSTGVTLSLDRPGQHETTTLHVTTDATGAHHDINDSLPADDTACGIASPLRAIQDPNTSAYSVPPQATAYVVDSCTTTPDVVLTPSVLAFAAGGRSFAGNVSGLRPQATYSESIDNGPVLGTVTASAAGVASFTFSDEGVACGTHAVTLTPSDASLGDDPGSATFTVTCPVATVTPATINPDSPPASVKVTTTGFDTRGTATVSIPGLGTVPADILNGQIGTYAAVTANAVQPHATSGRFTPGITLPYTEEEEAEELPCGVTMVTVTETGTGLDEPPTAQTPLTVNCPNNQTLTATPTTIAASQGTRTIRVTGGGWKPNSTVSLQADGVPLATLPTDAAGAFDLPVTLTADHAEVLTLAIPSVYPRTGRSVLITVTQPKLTVAPASYTLLVNEDGSLMTPSPTASPAATAHAVAAPAVTTTPTATGTPSPTASASATPTATTPPYFDGTVTTPSSVLVTGSGYDPRQAVNVSVPGQTAATPVTADANGGFTLRVPTATIPCGNDTIAGAEPVTNAAAYTVGPNASAPLAVTCVRRTPPPTSASPTASPTPTGNPTTTGSIAVNPATIAWTGSARPITITGKSFAPGSSVVLSGEGFADATTTTTATGTFSVVVQENGACGDHPVTAKPAVGFSVGGKYTVTCPRVATSPSTFDGLGLPATATVTGSGYDPSSSVVVSLEQTGQTAITTTVKSDGTGSFSTTLPTTALVCGSAPVVGTEKVASGTAPTASVVDTVTCNQPTVTVSPAVVPLGTVALISGTNFHPGSHVTLTWRLPDGTPGVGECGATVKSDRTFSAQCLILDHGVTGPRSAVALDDAGTGASGTALVVQNPTVPGRGSGTSERSLLTRR